MMWRRLMRTRRKQRSYGVIYTPKDFIQIRWGYLNWSWEYLP